MPARTSSLLKPQTLTGVLQLNPQKDRLYALGTTASIDMSGDDVLVDVALQQMDVVERADGFVRFEPRDAGELRRVRITFYPGVVLRISIAASGRCVPDSPMLDFAPDMKPLPVRIEQDDRVVRLHHESDALSWFTQAPFAPSFSSGPLEGVRFEANAHFMPPPRMWEALPAWVLRREDGASECGFSIHASPGERFAGTGERFAPLDLRGRSIAIDNENAYGSHTRRTYKSVPFILSSRPYGVFVHSSNTQHIDFAAYCNTAVQWSVQSEDIDIFFVAGATPADVLRNYRRITGFPPMPPVWSFGVWMSRLTYRSADEMLQTARKLRQEHIPVDVLHQDTAWFPEMVESKGFGPDNPKRALYGKCDWRFSPERFPDPRKFFATMRDMGVRVSLWQWPHVRRDTIHSHHAREHRFVGRMDGEPTHALFGDTLDLTHDAGREWYKSLLEPVLREGASAIKADFGEWIDPHAEYAGMHVDTYHNLFALLYQKCVWEATQAVYDQPVIWARSGWAGAQRYPVHWAGDPLSTFDGLATTLLAGQHLGLSGFAFWSHDVGGFVGQPEFLDTPPTDELYLRWTQAGVFTSHMRYHGCQPREPWHFPSVTDIVRQWLSFRYMLLPYILQESKACCVSGLPVIRALALEWPHDPMSWAAAIDQYLFGSHFLVCPVLVEGANERDVYIPEGHWVDFWTGECHVGPRRLHRVPAPMHRVPLYVRHDAVVVFCEPIQCTDAYPSAQRFDVTFDSSYGGWERTEPGALVPLTCS